MFNKYKLKCSNIQYLALIGTTTSHFQFMPKLTKLNKKWIELHGTYYQLGGLARPPNENLHTEIFRYGQFVEENI
jgi:hypothetical protein